MLMSYDTVVTQVFYLMNCDDMCINTNCAVIEKLKCLQMTKKM